MEVRDYGLYIAGKTLPASSSQTAEVLDPATNRPIARVASGTKDDANAAVDAARLAFESPEWRDLDPSKRGRLLWLLGQQVRDHFDELSRLESQNVGKPLPHQGQGRLRRLKNFQIPVPEPPCLQGSEQLKQVRRIDVHGQAEAMERYPGPAPKKLSVNRGHNPHHSGEGIRNHAATV